MRSVKIEAAGKAVLNLNPFFYPRKVLEETALAFRAVCSASISEQGDRIALELNFFKQGGAEEKALSFLNYALALRREIT